MSSTYLAPALQANLPPRAKLALIALANSTSPEGELSINPASLARSLWRGATEDDARQQIDILVRAGYLARAPEFDDLFSNAGTGYQAFETIWENGRIQA